MASAGLATLAAAALTSENPGSRHRSHFPRCRKARISKHHQGKQPTPDSTPEGAARGSKREREKKMSLQGPSIGAYGPIAARVFFFIKIIGTASHSPGPNGPLPRCSQNLAFARIARKNYADARLLVLAKFLQLLACSHSRQHVPDCSKFRLSCFVVIFYTYINDKSVMIWLKQKG